MEILVFAIKPPIPPLMALIFIHLYPTFFRLQLNLTYMIRFLHLVQVKIIILKSSYKSPAAECHIHGHLNYYMFIL